MNHHTERNKFKVGRTLHDAWDHIQGSKAAILLTAINMIVLAWLFHFVAYKIFGIHAKQPGYLLSYIVMPILTNALIAPFYAGLVMIGVKRTRGETIKLGDGFQYFQRLGSLALLMVIISFISSLMVILVNIPGFQVSEMQKGWLDMAAGVLSLVVYTFFLLSIPLFVDKKRSISQALTESAHLVAPDWLKVLATILVVYVMLLVAVIPVFLGLMLQNLYVMLFGLAILIVAMVWLIPFIFLIQGVIYNKLTA